MTDENMRSVDLGKRVVGEIDLPSFDVRPYIGKELKIEKVEELEGKYGFCVRISTEIVDTFKNAQGEDIEIRGSKIFGLFVDKDENIGWGDRTKLGRFLKKMGVTHYKKLLGKPVILQSKTGEDGRDYLEFN